VSAGHPHRRPNERHDHELDALRAEPAVRRRLALRFRLDTNHDVADLAGYSTTGGVIYVDRHLYAALRAGMIELPGRPAGETVHLIVHALATHEHTEKSLIDAKGFSYPAAHEFATLAEHQALRRRGVAPFAYEAALRPYIKRAAAEQIEVPPKDLDCTPLLDDPDHNDRRVLAVYRQLGVDDAIRRGSEHDIALPNKDEPPGGPLPPPPPPPPP